MNEDDHLLGLGKIVGNLHTLEFVIRIFLGDAAGQKLEIPKPTTAKLPETFITNFMSLGELIEKYNGVLTLAEKDYFVGGDAVKIRDAIAHGRQFSVTEGFPVTLYKFGKVQNGMVPVEFAEVLSDDWLKKKREFLLVQIKNVLACAKGRGYKTLE
jgi:hypothetical protein